MVVFTCQHCNASLKRVAVAKHYSQACRNNAPYLTCVDCLKDFHGEDYDSHMTCITEDERYGDKNFVPKKMGVKQTEWIDIVHLCAKKNDNPRFKFLFSKLASYQNVPRKKPKFLNFIKSSLPKFSQDIAVEVFQIIDEEFLKQKKKDCQNENNINKSDNVDETLNDANEAIEKSDEKKKKKKRNRNSESEALPGEDADTKSPAEGKSKKKKKLKNMDKTSPNESQELESADTTKLVNSKVKSKKNKNKNDSLNESSDDVDDKENTSVNNENGIQSHEEPNEIDNHAKLSKKELKKLKKKQKYDAELKNIKETESNKDIELKNETNDEDSTKPSKKQKKKKATVSESELKNETNDEDSKKPSKKQKKRKATVSESENGTGKKPKVEDNEEPENCSFENNLNGIEEKNKGKVRFNWEEIIKEVLRKNPDHEMSLKKISKKVLAEYQAVKGERESYEELISKFNKKINKTVGVRVLKDKAKLISED